MTLSISFQSTQCVHDVSPESLNERTRAIMALHTWRECQISLLDVTEHGLIDGYFVVQSVADSSDSSDDPDTGDADFVTALSVLCELSHAFEVDWVLWHEFEPHLGTIRKGVLDENLVREIETALSISRSLHEMIVDDEFVGDELPTRPAVDLLQLDGQSDWKPELAGEFKRFPEMDEDE